LKDEARNQAVLNKKEYLLPGKSNSISLNKSTCLQHGLFHWMLQIVSIQGPLQRLGLSISWQHSIGWF
jgi:hypothetical protein